jgi:hypothetical protein
VEPGGQRASTVAAPTAAALLDVWEQALHQSPAERALTLLAAAQPGVDAEKLAVLPVGARDARLLRLRARLFGSCLVAVASCPACEERVELSVEASRILDATGESSAAETLMQIDHDGYHVRFRSPTTSDLIGLEQAESVETARLRLLERCLFAAELNGVPVSAGALPPGIITAIAQRMSESDPLAEIALASTCPACAREWTVTLDVAAFFWTELHAWAKQTLRDVHRLASGYGWREEDILSLSPFRRQAYLELLRNE